MITTSSSLAFRSLLKSAAFRLRVGEVSEPIRTPLGWHLLQRVAPETLDQALAEPSFVRLRGILLRVDESTPGARDRARTFELAQRIHERLRSGEEMRALAREFDEDPGGREREGDLGWIHRGQPGLARELKRACGGGGALALGTTPTGEPAFLLELQGDHLRRLPELLRARGFRQAR